ncbi:MAG: hypothetical protein LBQ47_05415 [Endomicrobium sp.]|nr:hypothetical protein [Endomicrobium sp.]
MIKKILLGAIAVFLSASASFAVTTYVMDSPTTNILNYGSYDISFRFFSDGGVHTRVDFGVFKLLNVGVSWELDQFLGNSDIKSAAPSLSVKFKIYEGDMKWPGIAIGYDGQGYFFDSRADGDYLQRGKGIYLVVGRELFFEGLVLDAGLNMDNFANPRICGFLNAIIPVYKESIFFMAEYDNINYFPKARLNFGVRLVLTQAIDIDFVIRDCWGKNAADKVPNERVFKVNYTGKF